MDDGGQQGVENGRRRGDVGEPILPVHRVTCRTHCQEQDEVGEESGDQHQQDQLERGGAQFSPPLLPDQERGQQEGQGETAQRPAGEDVQQQPADKGPDGALYGAPQEGPDGDQQEDRIRVGAEEGDPRQRGALGQCGQGQQR